MVHLTLPITFIKNMLFKNKPNAIKQAQTYLDACPIYETIIDTMLPFGVNGNKFNIFEPTEIIAYKVNDSDRRDIDIDYFKENFSHTYTLLSNLFNTNDRLSYFLNWLSYILNTGKKTRNCIVLTGVQGTGKGLLYEFIIKKAFGKKYCKELLSHHIKSNFTGELHNKLFVVAQEMEKRFSYDIMDRLKTYITDLDITIERKGLDSFTSINQFNMMLFSNSVTPVKIESSDRRFSVFKCDIHISNAEALILIKGLEEESPQFLKMVKSLNYDEKKATSLFESEERDIAKEGSLSEIELVADKLRTERFDELVDDYPEAEMSIEAIKEEINKYEGYIKSSSLKAFFEQILPEIEFKKLKLCIHFGKSTQRRIKDSGDRTHFYKIRDKYDSENSYKTTRHEQDRQMQYS